MGILYIQHNYFTKHKAVINSVKIIIKSKQLLIMVTFETKKKKVTKHWITKDSN